MDRLLVSRVGDPQLSGAAQYCGLGTLSTTSTYQSLSIGKYFENKNISSFSVFNLWLRDSFADIKRYISGCS